MTNISKKMILDFTDKDAVNDWEAIDDRIMGGISQSQAQYVSNVGLRFAGVVSLENNGGFASIRSKSGIYDLSETDGLTLRVRGDGRTYKISLRTDNFFDGISYQSEFDKGKDGWQEIHLPFKDFKPTHHGLKLNTAAPMDTSNVKSFGLFIANRREESFQLDIAWIRIM